MKLKLALSCTLTLLASQAMAMCYTVYDRDNRVVYQAQTAPVDMSQPLHETMPKRFPGGHLVFENTASCPPENITSGPSPLASAAMQGRTPLLTDRRTAEAMGLRYQPVGGNGNVVMVPQRPDTIRPGFTVIDAGAAATAAAPSVQSPVRASAQGSTVITELYDPPLTAVQRGADTRVMGNR